MARKTFISYKYSESKELRDRIINRLGSDATYYKGENGYSPNMSSYTSLTIKEYLKNMIYDTSVTIVILSPNMRLSQWIEWEIEYSLKSISRNDRTSKTNGIVCVVKKDYYLGYAWMKDCYGNWKTDNLFPIIKKNMNNAKNKLRNAYLGLSENYIDIVTEDDFLRHPQKYIEESHKKSENIDSYNITKQTEKVF